MFNTLDITNWEQKGQDLHDAIVKFVKPLATSKLIVPIPDAITMTQAQYDDLHRLKGIENMYHSEDKMYITPYNVMEVRVEGRARPTFTEVMDFSYKEFERWEKATEQGTKGGTTW